MTTGDLERLLSRIDEHVDTMLGLFEANVENCALRGLPG